MHMHRETCIVQSKDLLLSVNRITSVPKFYSIRSFLWYLLV